MTEKCKNCNADIEWKLDETRSKYRMWEHREWHVCKEHKTIVNLKPFWWFCMGCMEKLDVINHPCIHFQKLNPTERGMIKMRVKKK